MKKNIFPTTPDLFGLHSIIDYQRLMQLNSGKEEHKVVKSKKVFGKNNENIKVKNYSRKMMNK